MDESVKAEMEKLSGWKPPPRAGRKLKSLNGLAHAPGGGRNSSQDFSQSPSRHFY